MVWGSQSALYCPLLNETERQHSENAVVGKADGSLAPVRLIFSETCVKVQEDAADLMVGTGDRRR